MPFCYNLSRLQFPQLSYEDNNINGSREKKQRNLCEMLWELRRGGAVNSTGMIGNLSKESNA